VKVHIAVNDEPTSADVEPRLLLVDYLRNVVGLKATNIGCDTTTCGTCTVLIDGQAVKSCTVLTVQADQTTVTTMEGLDGAAAGEPAHPVTRAFRQEHGLQCGFCTPGMVMAAVDLIAANPDPRGATGLEPATAWTTTEAHVVSSPPGPHAGARHAPAPWCKALEPRRAESDTGEAREALGRPAAA
jgi:aerobic-type carbon monoxide dehydrogenase small subunit (CoxS/CutS family)